MTAVLLTGATCVIALLVIALAVFGFARKWALRVERSGDALVDRVHRLQATMTIGVIVSMVAGFAVLLVPLLIVAGHAKKSAHHQDGIGRVLIIVVVTVVVTSVAFAPAFALVRAVRPSYGRLRDASLKQPGAASRLAVTGLIGAVVVAALHAVSAVAPKDGIAHGTVVGASYVLILLVAQIVLAPLLVRSLKSTPLPPDAEQRMAALAKRMDVRVAGFRCYPRRAQRQANALQVGLIPQLRYILISDYLLENLTPEEADAVIAHELGHARQRHLLIKLGSMLAVWAVLEAALGAISLLTNHGDVSSQLWAIPIVLAIPAGLVLVQGLVGVRLEERADDVAAVAVGPEAMVAALNKLADLNDAKRDTGRGWAMLTQHPGIDVRVARLRPQAAPERVAS